jgi:hypothetical protein
MDRAGLQVVTNCTITIYSSVSFIGISKRNLGCSVNRNQLQKYGAGSPTNKVEKRFGGCEPHA